MSIVKIITVCKKNLHTAESIAEYQEKFGDLLPGLAHCTAIPVF